MDFRAKEIVYAYILEHIDQTDTFMIVGLLGIKLGTADMMAFAVVAGHLVTQPDHALSQGFYYDLYTTFTGGDPLVTQHSDF